MTNATATVSDQCICYTLYIMTRALSAPTPSRLLPSLDDALARYPLDHEPVPMPVPELRVARAARHGDAGRVASAVGA